MYLLRFGFLTERKALGAAELLSSVTLTSLVREAYTLLNFCADLLLPNIKIILFVDIEVDIFFIKRV